MNSIKKLFVDQNWKPAKSKRGSTSLATYFDSHLTRFGVETRFIDFHKGDYTVEFQAGVVKFISRSYGTEIHVTISNSKDKMEQLATFLIIWKDLVDRTEIWGGEYIKDILLEDAPEEKEMPPNRQEGRYRLSEEEIAYRRGIVEKAEKMKKENPLMRWKDIDKKFAKELEISEESFRKWRHNNY